jgi:hypothetical protein
MSPCRTLALRSSIPRHRLPVQSQERPGPLDLTPTNREVSAPPPSVLLTARVIENLSEVAYPEGIKSPKVELNANARYGRFRCVFLPFSLRLSYSLLCVDTTVTSLCSSCTSARRSRLPFLLSMSLALKPVDQASSRKSETAFGKP